MRLALQIEGGTAGDTMGEIEVQWTDAAPIGDGETFSIIFSKRKISAGLSSSCSAITVSPISRSSR
jgi:hypothetical protein